MSSRSETSRPGEAFAVAPYGCTDVPYRTWSYSLAALPNVTPYQFAHDTQPGGNKVYIEFQTFEEYAGVLRENPGFNLYEIIRGHHDTMTFIDVDRKDNKYEPAIVLAALVRAFQDFCEEYHGRRFVIEFGVNANAADSTIPNKTSLHLVAHIGMHGHLAHKHFTLSFYRWIERRADQFPELMMGPVCVVDDKLHGTYRCLRALYQEKCGKNNPLLPVAGSTTDAVAMLARVHVQQPVFWSKPQCVASEPSAVPPSQKVKERVHKPSVASIMQVTPSEVLTRYTTLFNSKACLVELMKGPVKVSAVMDLYDDTTVYRLKDACCPYAGRQHKSNHVYLTTRGTNPDLTVRCNDDDCRKKYEGTSGYVIKHYDDVDIAVCDSMNLDCMHPQQDSIIWAQDYDEPAMRPLPVAPVVCVRGGMGVGKTKAMIDLVHREFEKNTKALVVTFSKSLARKLHGDFASHGFVDYQAESGPISAARVVVCLDSLWRVSTRNFDYVFVDEAVSVLLHFNSPLMAKSSENATLFELLLQQTRHAYFVDACIDMTFSKQIVDYIARFKAVAPLWVRNRYVRPSNRTATMRVSRGSCGGVIDEHSLATSAVAKVMEKLEQGKRVVVCSSTKSFVTMLETYVGTARPETRILAYHSGVSESLSNVNDLWKSCDLLVYSPSVSAGVSFEAVHFDCLVAFLVNSTATPSVDISLQQLFRVRNLTDGDMNLFVQDTSYDRTLPCSDHEIDRMLRQDVSVLNKYYLASSQLSFSAPHVIVDGCIKYDPDRMSYIVVKGIVMMRHRSLLYYSATLENTLRDDYGIQCVTESEKVDESQYDVDTGLLMASMKTTDKVEFDQVPMLAALPDGAHRYRIICDAMDRSSDVEKAAKRMYDYAERLWMVPVEKVDAHFFKEYVMHDNSRERYMQAKRYMMMKTSTIQENRDAMSRKMDRISFTSGDGTLDLYKSKLRAHYSMLITGQTLLKASLTAEQADATIRGEDVTVAIEAIERACSALRDGMAPKELAAFNKLFEVKTSTTPFLMEGAIAGVRTQRRAQVQEGRPGRVPLRGCVLQLNGGPCADIFSRHPIRRRTS
jgi:Origin of replication binding protein